MAAALLKPPEPHVLALEHEQIERIEHDLRGFATIPQQQVEGGLAFPVERHNFTFDHSLPGQFQQRLRHPCKPVREVLMVTRPQLAVATKFPPNRTKPVELQLILP